MGAAIKNRDALSKLAQIHSPRNAELNITENKGRVNISNSNRIQKASCSFTFGFKERLEIINIASAAHANERPLAHPFTVNKPKGKMLSRQSKDLLKISRLKCMSYFLMTFEYDLRSV